MNTKTCDTCKETKPAQTFDRRYIARCRTCTNAMVHPLRNIHSNMKDRCSNPNNVFYDRYGGRGISVHESLLDFKSFVAYIEANLGPRPKGFSLDRIDNQRNYEPGNLRWASQSTQSQNRGKRLLGRTTSKYMGVTYDKKGRGRPFKAQLMVNGVNRHLGYFKYEEAAAVARDRAALKANREGASFVLNFPQGGN